MAPHDLTPAEIAQLLAPVNHPSPLSADELEQLVGHLNDEQMEELVDLMGLGTLARQLPPVLLKVMRAAQRITRDSPPEYDNEIDTIIRNLDLVEISGTSKQLTVSCYIYILQIRRLLRRLPPVPLSRRRPPPRRTPPPRPTPPHPC
jgi:hypothetical protein